MQIRKIKNILPLLILASLLVLPAIGGGTNGDLKEPPEPKIIGEGGVLDKITNYLFTALLTVAGIFIIIAGYQFVTAAGDPEKYNKAKKALFYALIGVLVAFSAKALVKLIETVVSPSVPGPEGIEG